MEDLQEAHQREAGQRRCSGPREGPGSCEDPAQERPEPQGEERWLIFCA